MLLQSLKRWELSKLVLRKTNLAVEPKMLLHELLAGDIFEVDIIHGVTDGSLAGI